MRKALGDEGQTYIKTVPRRGYMFVADVDADSRRPESSVAGFPRWTTPSWAVIAVAAVFILVFGSLATFVLRPIEESFPSDQRLKIAVLPFETSSEAPEDRWLGDGIAEDIMTELSRFSDIGVIARNSSFRYGGQNLNIDQLKTELGADFVLQGSVRLQDDQLRLALQLIDTDGGTNVWAERYDRPFTDVFTIRSDIVNQISSRLDTEARDVESVRAARHDPDSLDAYTLTLRASSAYWQFTKDSAIEGLALAERALTQDPNYAEAWDVLARLTVQFYVQPYDARRGEPETLARALSAALRAVELDPRSARTRATLGWLRIWNGQHAEAINDIRQAVLLNPSDVSIVMAYADGLSRAGFQQEALQAWAEAERLDPVVLPINKALIARSHILLGNFNDAFALTADCLQRAPAILPCNLFHTMAAKALSRDEDVAATVEQINRLAPQFTVSGWRKIVNLSNGNEADTLSGYLLSAGLEP